MSISNSVFFNAKKIISKAIFFRKRFTEFSNIFRHYSPIRISFPLIMTALIISFSPKPSQAGDGWDVFFDDKGHVFNVFHHNDSGNNPAVDCHTRNGQSCGANWPFYFNAGITNNTAPNFWNTTLTSNGWVDTQTKRLWFPTHTNLNTGFACLNIADIENPTFCESSRDNSFFALGSNPNAKAQDNRVASVQWPNSNGIGTIEVVNRKIYALESATGKLLCLDVDTKWACSSQPYQLVSSVNTFSGSINSNYIYRWAGHLLALEGRLYGLVGTIPLTNGLTPGMTYAVCFDPTTEQVCAGWHKTLNSVANNMYPLPSSSGAISGVCFTYSTTTASTSPECFDRNGSSIIDNSKFTTQLKMLDLGPGVTDIPNQSGSRLYWTDGTFSSSGQYLNCFDFSTDTSCVGWPILPNLVAGTVNSKTYYYSGLTYAITIDERNCIWKNGDDTLIAAFTPDGSPQGWFLGNTSSTIASNICTAQTLCDVSSARTLSQGGWSSKRSTSPLTDTFFDEKFASDLIIGGSSAHVKLTTASAARGFLPNSGTPRRLISKYTDPKSSDIKNTLAGQTVAAMLNVAYNQGMAFAEVQSGTYAGKTVTEIIDRANNALDGGQPGPDTYSGLNAVLNSINLSFEQGVPSGFLACPAN